MRETLFDPTLKTKESKNKRRCCRWVRGTFNIKLTKEEKEANDKMKKAFSFEKFLEMQEALTEINNRLGIENKEKTVKTSP